MNELKIFKNENFGEVRTMKVNDVPYFCLKDVCEILKLNNVSQTKARLKEGEPYIITSEVWVQTGFKANGEPATRMTKMNFINEVNLYKCILQSRTQQAETFQIWVTEEVLPSIRKTGSYNIEDKLPKNYKEALLQLVEQVDKNEKLALENKAQSETIEKMKPKVEFANAIIKSETPLPVGDFAKILYQNGIKFGRNTFYSYLRKHNYLVKNGKSKNMPTQTAMERKIFTIHEEYYINKDGNNVISRQTMVTPKGQYYFIRKFKQEQASEENERFEQMGLETTF